MISDFIPGLLCDFALPLLDDLIVELINFATLDTQDMIMMLSLVQFID